MSETIAQAEPGAASFTDLGAVVYPACVPGGLADELPGLYGSLFATEPWFRLFDRVSATGACVLESPRHVLFFWRDGDSIEVLNKAFPMAATLFAQFLTWHLARARTKGTVSGYV